MPAVAANKASSTQTFNKQLASSNRQTRDQALERLRLYLGRSTAFTPLDCLKLWKGLFYCMFMSDKPLNQQRLARNLAGLVDVLTTRENTLNFIEGFWKIMSREWNAIDSLRLDKYLYLIRCYVRKGFELCLSTRGQKWKLNDDYLAILRDDGGPLNSRDPKVPVGLRLHVLDTWVDELDKEDTSRTALVETFIAPLRDLAKETLTTSVRKRVKETLEDERLEDWKNEKVPEKTDDDGKDVNMQDRPNQVDEGENADFEGFDD
ncbi:Nop52-domain-containing protein [Dissoconium aciculare CBS 342.82]|uniref:Nop52-domain-containing protein n=1 Tax=Dissoconium aciculare CBS 342.82 TaxID=1314786 RepID=A0A6J3MH18_9PEZI|nr:Nop52-domain-containing protein [Dissoconium aciculare CBS 342.82]KAF1826192.1 Nop52-domain-containing protein [Dissoconium aciculare CBS 342.82]